VAVDFGHRPESSSRVGPGCCFDVLPSDDDQWSVTRQSRRAYWRKSVASCHCSGPDLRPSKPVITDLSALSARDAAGLRRTARRRHSKREMVILWDKITKNVCQPLSSNLETKSLARPVRPPLVW